MKPYLWEKMSGEIIANHLKKTPMVILPVGSTEEHGPHISVNVDSVIVTHLAMKVSEKTGVLVMPTLNYGLSQCIGNFPGILSLSPDLLYKVITEICTWTLKSGAKKLLILSGHGMNRGPCQCAMEQLRYTLPDDTYVKAMCYWEVSPEASQAFFRSKKPIYKNMHGNFTETACVMAIDESLVDMHKVVEQPDVMQTLWYYRKDQKTHTGNEGYGASLATKQAGVEILGALTDELSTWVKKALLEEKPKMAELLK